MIRVHLRPDLDVPSRDFSAAISFTYDDTGFLDVRNQDGLMATFAPGAWTYVETVRDDASPETGASA